MMHFWADKIKQKIFIFEPLIGQEGQNSSRKIEFISLKYTTKMVLVKRIFFHLMVSENRI